MLEAISIYLGSVLFMLILCREAGYKYIFYPLANTFMALAVISFFLSRKGGKRLSQELVKISRDIVKFWDTAFIGD